MLRAVAAVLAFVPPLAIGRFPVKAFAVTVPEPVGPSVDPVPTSMAAEVFVLPVIPEKAAAPAALMVCSAPPLTEYFSVCEVESARM